jgi:hypothetical protein
MRLLLFSAIAAVNDDVDGLGCGGHATNHAAGEGDMTNLSTQKRCPQPGLRASLLILVCAETLAAQGNYTSGA